MGCSGLGLFVRDDGVRPKRAWPARRRWRCWCCRLSFSSTREALRTVPKSLREGVVRAGRHQVADDPASGAARRDAGHADRADSGAVSRAIGETAPLITIGALTYVPFAPDSIWSPFTVLPIQIFDWLSRPQVAFAENASAGIIVLLVLLLVMNAVAIIPAGSLSAAPQLSRPSPPDS